jgi:hypothetical protein
MHSKRDGGGCMAAGTMHLEGERWRSSVNEGENQMNVRTKSMLKESIWKVGFYFQSSKSQSFEITILLQRNTRLKRMIVSNLKNM